MNKCCKHVHLRITTSEVHVSSFRDPKSCFSFKYRNMHFLANVTPVQLCGPEGKPVTLVTSLDVTSAVVKFQVSHFEIVFWGSHRSCPSWLNSLSVCLWFASC